MCDNFKMKLVLVWLIFTVLSRVRTLDLQESLVAPYANMLEENMATTELQQQMNLSMSAIIQNMVTYDFYIRNMTKQVLAEHQSNIQKKIREFKSDMTGAQSRSLIPAKGNDVIVKCVFNGARFDGLAEEINSQISRCATVAMAEMANVITNSYNEAQTFMSIPAVIGRDVQRCGLSNSCRWSIVGDAISEALQVPPKVFALTAKIQSIALRTVVSVDSCGLQGFRQIAETGFSIVQDIFTCISDKMNSNITRIG